jgi:hypothetical protein
VLLFQAMPKVFHKCKPYKISCSDILAPPIFYCCSSLHNYFTSIVFCFVLFSDDDHQDARWYDTNNVRYFCFCFCFCFVLWKTEYTGSFTTLTQMVIKNMYKNRKIVINFCCFSRNITLQHKTNKQNLKL